jgi:hypothetical protein
MAAPRLGAAAPTTAVPPAAAPVPAAQLALGLARLRTGPDGTHQLTIHLNPEELGPISVVAEVRGDNLSVHLSGATDAGREALRAALPQLERLLRDGGFASCTVDVGREAVPDRSARPAWSMTGDGQPGGPHGGRPGGQEGTQHGSPQGSHGPHGRQHDGRSDAHDDGHQAGRHQAEAGPDRDATATRSLDLHV